LGTWTVKVGRFGVRSLFRSRLRRRSSVTLVAAARAIRLRRVEGGTSRSAVICGARI
jgi:hypothetical protein